MVVKAVRREGILLAEMSHFLEFFRVIIFFASHIEDVSELSFTK